MTDNLNFSYDSSFFQCYICMLEVKKPKMCPSCSKLACQNCLRKWIEDTKSECPHCRKVLPLAGFADCQRFVNDVKHLISTMDSNQKNKQKCKQHKLQMQYFCLQCKQAICSDCGMFGIKHKGHSITHLSKIYQENKNKILNQLARFDQKIQSYRKNGFYIKIQMQKLMIQIGQKKSFIEQYFLSLIERLQEEFRQKKIKLQNQFEQNNQEIDLLQSFREQICHELEGKSQKEVISNSQQLISQIHKLCEKEKHKQFEQEQFNFQTIQEIVPKYQSFKYVMGKSLLNYEGITYSQPYTVNGIEWRLKLYPRGNGVAKQTHISVFLQMSKAYSNENKYEYKIQLLNYFNHKQTIIRQYSSKFDIGECWGYNQFIPLNQLQNGFMDQEGSLHFNISVRNPTYKSLVRDQQNYINFLQNRLKSNEQPNYRYKQRENISKLSLQSHTNRNQLKKILLNPNDQSRISQDYFTNQIINKNAIQMNRIEVNRNGIQMNRSGIEVNKSGIEVNRSGIEVNNKNRFVQNSDNMAMLQADSVEDQFNSIRLDDHDNSRLSSP